ncbi:uncharacterized protein [Hyperolius riggenbachi]|uniref:uncharacterized protein n=1 Tax=Hyperolius riggenbachi TaxID=752182 RepID=UPI0035A2E5C3
MPGKRGRPTRISRQRRCGNCDDEHGAAHGKRVNKKKEVSEQIPEDENVNAGDACQTLSDTSSVTQQPLMPVVDEQSQTVTIFLVPMEKATVASPVDIVNLENNQDSSSQNQNLENQGLVEETHEGSMNEQASNSNNDVNLSSENPIDMELMDNFEGVSMREPLLIDTASEIVNFRLALDDNIDSDDEGEEALDLSTRPACQNTVETLENDVHVSFDRELDIGHTEKESDQDANQANVHEENYFNQSKDAENVQEHNNNSKHRDCDDEEEDDNKSVQDVAEGQECVEDQDSEQGSSNYEDYEPTTSVNDFQGNRSSSDGWGDDDSSFLGDEYSVHDSAEDNNDSQEDVDTDTLISEVNDCDNHNRQRIAVLPDHANDSAPENSDVVVVNENVLDNSELHRNDSDMGSPGNMQTNEEANANNVDESFNETIINNSQQSKGGISRMPKFTIAENLMLCRFVCADYEFLLKRDKNEDVRRMKNQKWKYIGEKVNTNFYQVIITNSLITFQY